MRIDLLAPAPRAIMSRMFCRALERAAGAWLAAPPVDESLDGDPVRRYRLAVPDGVTVGVALGPWGEAGIGVEGEHVCVDAPMLASGILRTAAGDAVHGFRPLPDGRVRTLLDLQPGRCVVVPVGSVGKLGLRLAP